jgi:hypothetical protein
MNGTGSRGKGNVMMLLTIPEYIDGLPNIRGPEQLIAEARAGKGPLPLFGFFWLVPGFVEPCSASM